MTASWEIRGWCPGALRPMQSGDGLVVRIRARAGRLSPAQTRAIARAAEKFGNGLIDLSARANLQIRGVTEDSHPALIEALEPFGLIDTDIAAENRRNILVAPFGAHPALVAALEAALPELPPLPSKFGFAVDAGGARYLARASADIRLERGLSGGMILRADGAALGLPVTAETLAQPLLEIARWFIATGGVSDTGSGPRGRLASHLAHRALPASLAGTEPPVPETPPRSPGLHPEGALIGFALGEMKWDTLAALADLGQNLRLTPWRMVLIEEATELPQIPHLVTRPDDPLMRVSACTGAPRCPQALAPTRALARALAPRVPEDGHLHVSGCAKGCAHPAPAPHVLVATPEGFALVRNGRAGDPPAIRDLPPERLGDPELFLTDPRRGSDAPLL